MAIYDCFQYFNEEHIADLRFNILNEFVDYFVIVESTVNHQGKQKKLQFDINKYQRFEKKIIFVRAGCAASTRHLNLPCANESFSNSCAKTGKAKLWHTQRSIFQKLFRQTIIRNRSKERIAGQTRKL